MINRDIVESKLGFIRGYLTELAPLLATATETTFPDSTTRHAIERVFQLLVDSALDINTHIITRSNFEPAEDYQSTFTIIAKHGVIPEDLARRMAPSVGLRNLLVHGYEKVDIPQMLRSIAAGISQYEEYVTAVVAFLDRKSED